MTKAFLTGALVSVAFISGIQFAQAALLEGATGTVLVNGQPAAPDYAPQPGDLIQTLPGSAVVLNYGACQVSLGGGQQVTVSASPCEAPSTVSNYTPIVLGAVAAGGLLAIGLSAGDDNETSPPPT